MSLLMSSLVVTMHVMNMVDIFSKWPAARFYYLRCHPLDCTHHSK